jgi:hypothetical protein
MPDLVIWKVEVYGKLTTLQGSFDFANRNGILFNWNEEVDEFPEEIIKVKDIVLHPSHAAEHTGVVLGRDQPLLAIEEELVPQGRAEDAMACNAHLKLLDVAGVVAASMIVHTNADKLDVYKIFNNTGIIAVGDIPQQPPHTPLIVNNTDNNDIAGSEDDNNEAESNNDNGSNNNNNNSLGEDNNDKPADLAAVTDADDNKSGGNQGVQRLPRRGKG